MRLTARVQKRRQALPLALCSGAVTDRPTSTEGLFFKVGGRGCKEFNVNRALLDHIISSIFALLTRKAVSDYDNGDDLR